MHAEISMAAEPLLHIGGLTITNTIFTTYLVMILLVVLAFLATRRLSVEAPGTLQNVAELFVETFLGLVETTAGQKLGRRIFPLIGTLFIFILTANWLGLFPGFGTIGFYQIHEGHEVFVPLLRPANSDFNMTVAMALITVVLVQVVGVRTHGFFGYLKELAGPVWYMIPLLFPLHIISELSHILSLSARLFGNIFGGDVVLMVVYGLAPALAPAIFLVMETLFGLIQAIIFSLLSLVYFTLASQSHETH